jgi:hypothetical protein
MLSTAGLENQDSHHRVTLMVTIVHPTTTMFLEMQGGTTEVIEDRNTEMSRKTPTGGQAITTEMRLLFLNRLLRILMQHLHLMHRVISEEITITTQGMESSTQLSFARL